MKKILLGVVAALLLITSIFVHDYYFATARSIGNSYEFNSMHPFNQGNTVQIKFDRTTTHLFNITLQDQIIINTYGTLNAFTGDGRKNFFNGKLLPNEKGIVLIDGQRNITLSHAKIFDKLWELANSNSLEKVVNEFKNVANKTTKDNLGDEKLLQKNSLLNFIAEKYPDLLDDPLREFIKNNSLP